MKIAEVMIGDVFSWAPIPANLKRPKREAELINAWNRTFFSSTPAPVEQLTPPCLKCRGTGLLFGTIEPTCDDCNGTGKTSFSF